MLEEALADFDGSIIVVSHDRYFLDRICDQVVAFEDATGVFIQPGSYSYYLEKRKEREDRDRQLAQQFAVKPETPAAKPAPKTGKPRKLTFKEQRELESMEAEIHAAEARVAELEAQLNDPAFYAQRGREVPALLAAIQACKAETVRLFGRWEELEAIRAGSLPQHPPP